MALRLSDQQLADLAAVAQALDDAGIWWAVSVNAASIQYGSARELEDVHIIVRNRSDLKRACKALEMFNPTKLGEKKRGILRYFGFGLGLPALEVELASEVRITVAGKEYSFAVDADMERRVKKFEFHRAREGAVPSVMVPMLSPEDVVAFKAIAQRGPQEGKHDLSDAKAVIEKQIIDWRYLEERARRCGAYERVFSVLPINRG